MTLRRFVGLAILIVVLIGALASGVLLLSRMMVPAPVIVIAPVVASTTPPRVVNTVTYLCDQKRTVSAVFMESTMPAAPITPGAPPNPTGSIVLTFDTSSPVTLAQSVSADGARYASIDGTLVFWSKGRGAMIENNGTASSYQNCIEVAVDPGLLPQVYQDGTTGFTVRYPALYVATTSTYTELGPKKFISGVTFTIPSTIATGTNLSLDTYVSVEHQPLNLADCKAEAFLDSALSGSSTMITANDRQYSYASSTGAATGNRYEEQVFIRFGSESCVAVRYFVHYGVFENYPTGTIQAFDRNRLLVSFDAIRDSLVLK